jgi:tyrosine-protein kinase Etk/Wzc
MGSNAHLAAVLSFSRGEQHHVPNTAQLMKAKDRTSDAGTENSDEVPFASVIDALINHRKMIGVVVAIFLVLGAAYAFLSPPVYQGAILLKVDNNADASSPRGNDPLSNMSPVLDEKSSAEAEIQVLGSKLVVSRAVDTLKLYVSARPRRLPVIGERLAHHDGQLSEPGLFGMGDYAWGDESIELRTLDVPRQLEGATFVLVAKAGGRYELTGKGLPQPVTGMIGRQEQFETIDGPITLQVESIKGAPGVGFNLMRSSRQLTIDALQQRLKIEEQGNKSSVLKATLESTDAVQVAATINEIGRQYVRLNADRKAVIAENSLTYLQRQLPILKEQMEDAETAYNQYRNANALLDTNEANRLLLQQSVDATTQLLSLKRNRQDLAATFSNTYPKVVALDQQIAATQQFLTQLDTRTKSMPMEEQGALRLLRDVRVNTDLYSALKNNIEGMRLIKAGKAASVQLIDIADVPERPVKPVKILVLTIAMALGIFAGTGMALLSDRLFRGVTDTQEIEVETGLSVYATIPLSARQPALAKRFYSAPPQPAVLASQFPKDPTVEALRILRSALQFAMVGARNNVVMLAGPLPGVGKSFLSANLATVLAAGGKRVLLIDADLRKGYLHQYFGLRPGPGLADVLAGFCPFGDCLHSEVLPNLDFLQGGPYPPNPAELLLSTAYHDLIKQASVKYDIVMVDAAAVLAVSDAGAMAPVAGSIFLIALFGETRIGEIKETIKRLAQTGARVNGVLLNGVTLHMANKVLAGRYGSSAYVSHNYESTPK